MGWLKERKRIRREVLIRTMRKHGEDTGYALGRCAGIGVKAYFVLAELESDGLVESWREDGPKPRRRLYRLTSSLNVVVPAAGVPAERGLELATIAADLAKGMCDSCGAPMLYNLAAGYRAHTVATTCDDPWPR